MTINQKSQYALKALLELARLNGERPVSVGEIAQSHNIPIRFLEVILNELRQGGFVESRRGKSGGFVLASAPRDLTVGAVIRFLQGPGSNLAISDEDNPCVFAELWQRVDEATSAIVDHTSFQDLLDREAQLAATYIPNFNI